jgi:excisionase family DNA binding protein
MHSIKGRKQFIGTKDAAKILHVDPSTVQRWIDARLIPSFRTAGGHRRISIQHLNEFIASRNVPTTKADPSRVNPCVLVVDDEEDILDFLRIRIRGFRPEIDVITATNGFQAGATIYKRHPDLVLLDIRMPGMDGIEVCRMIKEDPSTRATRVIGITASRESAEIEALLRAGAECVLSKPIESQAVKELVDDCFPLAPSSPSGARLEAASGGDASALRSASGRAPEPGRV